MINKGDIKKDIKTDDVWSFIGDLFNLQNG